MVLFWTNVEIYGKTAVFPGGYGRIGEIHMGGYGRIGVFSKKNVHLEDYQRKTVDYKSLQ